MQKKLEAVVLEALKLCILQSHDKQICRSFIHQIIEKVEYTRSHLQIYRNINLFRT